MLSIKKGSSKERAEKKQSKEIKVGKSPHRDCAFFQNRMGGKVILEKAEAMTKMKNGQQSSKLERNAVL